MSEKKLKYLVIDVDGTMTDGGIYYDESGNETKKFNTRDAAGFFAAQHFGIKIIVLTGRECKATKRRMSELKVNYLFENVQDKRAFLVDFLEENNIAKGEVGYIGDDLNDYASMKLVGYIACPADACQEVKEIADYISKKAGGEGVIRDVVECMFRKQHFWDDVIKQIYGNGI